MDAYTRDPHPVGRQSARRMPVSAVHRSIRANAPAPAAHLSSKSGRDCGLQSHNCRSLSHHGRPWTLVNAPGKTLVRPVPACERTGDSETAVLVAVRDGLLVAVRGTQISGIVVPRAAAQLVTKPSDEAYTAGNAYLCTYFCNAAW